MTGRKNEFVQSESCLEESGWLALLRVCLNIVKPATDTKGTDKAARVPERV